MCLFLAVRSVTVAGIYFVIYVGTRLDVSPKLCASDLLESDPGLSDRPAGEVDHQASHRQHSPLQEAQHAFSVQKQKQILFRSYLKT